MTRPHRKVTSSPAAEEQAAALHDGKILTGLVDLLPRLAAASPRLETELDWPGEQFAWLADAGVLRWVIPPDFGGDGVSAADLMRGYEQLASACLTTTFVLTQRNGACQRIATLGDEDLQGRLLPRLARGELFATVGISHLTTSGRHKREPAVRIAADADGVILDGAIPWVTGAAHADYIVTGGTCTDGRQMLVVLPTEIDGVLVRSPAKLLGLNASQTASVDLASVRVPNSCLLAGPSDNVMLEGEAGGTGGLATSALAVGLSERSIGMLGEESSRRRELVEIAEALRSELETLRLDLHAAARGAPVQKHAVDSAGTGEQSPATGIRRRANSLVLRAAQAQLAAAKGAGYVAGHPAEQTIREAMFFLVWSCPPPVQAGALREFAGLPRA